MTTPHHALAQGIFDIVVERGSRLERRCVDPLVGTCAYRDGKGGACYVGLLLSDEEVLDGKGRLIQGGVNSLLHDGLLPERLLPFTDLITRLQYVHDNSGNWENEGRGAPRRSRIAEELRAVAANFGLGDALVNTHYHA